MDAGATARTGQLRVLIVMSVPYPGTSPIANHMQRLARGLRREGHTVRMVAPRKPGDELPEEGLDRYGIPYSSFNIPKRPRGLPFYPHWVYCIRPRLDATVARLIEEEKPDAVILMGETWYAFRGVRKLCRVSGVRVLAYPIEWFPPYFASVAGLSWFDQCLHRAFTYPNCDGIIGISRFWKEWAEARKVPAVVVPSFSKFAEDELPAVSGERHKRFRIVFVGRWVARELPGTLFSALDIALGKGVDLELVVLGVAGKPVSISQAIEERPALRRLAKLPRVAERIRFLGFVPDEELVRQMNEADAFVLLRRQSRETRALFPTRLPEFLATGKPVIVSDAGDLALYLRHGESAWVVPPGDRPLELAEAIVHLAGHPDEAAAIGLGGRRALIQSFSQEKLARRVADFIGQLAGGRGEQRIEACAGAAT